MIDGVLKVQQSSQQTKKGHKDQHPLIKLLFNRYNNNSKNYYVQVSKNSASTRASVYPSRCCLIVSSNRQSQLEVQKNED